MRLNLGFKGKVLLVIVRIVQALKNCGNREGVFNRGRASVEAGRLVSDRLSVIPRTLSSFLGSLWLLVVLLGACFELKMMTIAKIYWLSLRIIAVMRTFSTNTLVSLHIDTLLHVLDVSLTV